MCIYGELGMRYGRVEESLSQLEWELGKTCSFLILIVVRERATFHGTKPVVAIVVYGSCLRLV